MARHIGYDGLKTLYELAIDIGELEPWEFMNEEEAWVLRFPDVNLYAVVTGAEGISLALVFYWGVRGYAAWQDLTSQHLDEKDAIQRLDSLTVFFESWSQLGHDDKKRLQRLGYIGGPGLWPNMTRYLPGRVPAYPDGDEITLLIPALRASLSLLKLRKKAGIRWSLPEGEDTLPNFVVDPKGHPGPIQWLSAPEIQKEKLPPAAPPDELGLRRISKASLAPDVSWEIMIGNSGMGVRDTKGNGGFVPLLATFVRADSGFVLGFAMASSDEMPYTLPNQLMEAIKKHGAYPRSLKVKQEELVEWLKPLAGGLGIEIERVKSVPMAEEALTSIQEAARSGELKRTR